jgi:hypothetical protein
VECNPFDAKRLQLLIQSRHKTSGLTYYYNNVPEKSISKIKTASLFNNYFSYSHGVPGVALNAWIGNITKVDKQEIYITKPKYPNYHILNNINPDWLITGALFIQHKNITAKKLSRIMGISEIEAEDLIYNLSNARIIEVRDKGVYSLERYLEPFFVKIIVDKGII